MYYEFSACAAAACMNRRKQGSLNLVLLMKLVNLPENTIFTSTKFTKFSKNSKFTGIGFTSDSERGTIEGVRWNCEVKRTKARRD